MEEKDNLGTDVNTDAGGDAEDEEMVSMTKAELERLKLFEGDQRTKQAEPKLREKFYADFQAEIAKQKEIDAAKRKGEFDKIEQGYKEEVATERAKADKALKFAERELAKVITTIPEELHWLIPEGNATDKMDFIDENENFKKMLAKFTAEEKPVPNMGGKGLNDTVPAPKSGKEYTAKEIKNMTKAQKNAMSTDDMKKYSDMYGVNVFSGR